MNKVNYWAIAVAAVITLLASSVYYTVFGGLWQSMRPDAAAASAPQAWEVIGQLGRNVVEILVLAVLMRRLNITTWLAAVRLGLLVWVGFQAIAVAGSVLHENYPVGLFALHIGDALMTTLIAVSVLAAWRRPA
ncbi:MAG: DUF1761 domain-containing protein [Nonomuraea sp.]|nr:DUF1761 domain-containing protein [Nonomuraea sp.]